MAHRKAGGSTSLGRDSRAQRLGVKIFGEQPAKVGNVIVRQRGTKFHPGKNVKKGADDTLFAMANGLVKFTKRKMVKYSGKLETRQFVSVVPVK